MNRKGYPMGESSKPNTHRPEVYVPSGRSLDDYDGLYMHIIGKMGNLPMVVTSDSKTYTPVNPETPIAPYFICKSVHNDKMFNALGLLGATLLADNNVYSNRVSGFLTLFSLMTEEVPGIKETVYSGWKCNPQPTEVYSIQSLYDKIKFLHPQTNVIFKSILEAKEMQSSDGIIIQSNVDFYKELQNIPSLNFPKVYTTAMCGISYLMMFNYVDKVDFTSWVSHKWNLFARLLTVSKPAANQSVFPGLKSCILFDQDHYSGFYARRQLFQIIREINKGHGAWSSVCGLIMHLSKYSKMGHIRLINKYVFVENPVIILEEKVKFELQLILRLLSQIQKEKIDFSDLPYYRILYNDIGTTTQFTRKNYPVLWYIANQIRFSNNPPDKAAGEKLSIGVKHQLDQCIVKAFEKKSDLATGNQEARLLFQQAEQILAPARKMLNMLADPYTEDSGMISRR